MSYAIRLSREAEGDLEVLARSDSKLFLRILRKVELLSGSPRAGKPLVGNHRGEFSLRVGDRRIVYEIEETDKTIYILTVKHRRHVY